MFKFYLQLLVFVYYYHFKFVNTSLPWLVSLNMFFLKAASCLNTSSDPMMFLIKLNFYCKTLTWWLLGGVILDCTGQNIEWWPVLLTVWVLPPNSVRLKSRQICGNSIVTSNCNLIFPCPNPIKFQIKVTSWPWMLSGIILAQLIFLLHPSWLNMGHRMRKYKSAE